MYTKFFKRLIDIVLSGCALIVLSPLYLILILAIKIDSPGPVLFKQKRVGIHKTYLHGYKFQTELFSNKYNQNSGIISKNGWFI